METYKNNYIEFRHWLSARYEVQSKTNLQWVTEALNFDSTHPERGTKLLEMIRGLYYNYDIAEPVSTDNISTLYNNYNDEYNTLFSYTMNCITSFIRQWKDYYIEMIDNYEKEYDYQTGITRQVEAKGIAVDLPNKKVDDTDIYKYPSSGDKTTSVVTDNSKMIYLKKQYMSQIRDLYIEFANRFKDMFMHIF